MFSSPVWFIAAAIAVTAIAIIGFKGSAVQPCQVKDENSRKLEQPSWMEVTDFYELVVNDLFIDKSLLIKTFLSAGKVVQILRPSGWGKSTNVDMLKKFLELETDERGEPSTPDKRINVKLFTGGTIIDGNRTVELKRLNVAQEKAIMDSQGSHPVIQISLRHVTGVTYEEIEYKLKLTIARMFAKRHDYLRPKSEVEAKLYDSLCEGKASERDFELSLLFLSELLYKRYQRRVYILIDDYDVPPVNLFLNKAGQLVNPKKCMKDTSDSVVVMDEKVKEAVDKAANSITLHKVECLLRRLFGNCLRGNDALNQALLTGIFDVPLDDHNSTTGSSTNTTESLVKARYNLLNEEFRPWYGLSGQEVEQLLGKTASSFDNKLPDIHAMRDWYGNNAGGCEMYNTRSVRRFVANGAKFAPYWTDRDVTQLASFVLSTKAAQCLTQSLCHSEFFTSRIYKKLCYRNVSRDATALFYSGYIGVALCNYGVSAEIAVANREMKNITVAKMVAWLCKHLHGVTSETFTSLAEDLTSFEVTNFQEKLRKVLAAFPVAGPNESEEEIYYAGVMKSVIQFFGEDYIVNVDVPPSSPKQSVTILAKATSRRKNAIVLHYRLVNNTEERDKLLQADAEYLSTYKSDVNRQLYPHIERVLKIAIVFYLKDFRMEHQIDPNGTETKDQLQIPSPPASRKKLKKSTIK